MSRTPNTSQSAALDADSPDAFCSTRQAATRLDVSVGTVQQMVEQGVLSGWKTAGGHRRISLRSLETLLRSRVGATSSSDAHTLSVLIVEDDPFEQAFYRETLAEMKLPLKLEIVGNGFDGLLVVGRQRPDVLISDLILPGMDGFLMIRALRADPDLSYLDIVVVSGLSNEEIAERGGLPEDVTVFSKPIPFRELHGYLLAKRIQLGRRGAR